MKLDEFIKWKGYLSSEEMCRAFVESRVVVMPSLWPEPFGITALEAFAHGRPVVGFEVGGLKELLVKGGTFALYADSRDLADKLLLFLENERFAEEKGREGYEHAKTNFSPEAHVDKLLKLIKG